MGGGPDPLDATFIGSHRQQNHGSGDRSSGRAWCHASSGSPESVDCEVSMAGHRQPLSEDPLCVVRSLTR